MILLIYVVFILFTANINCFTINGKDYHITQVEEEGVSRGVIYANSSTSAPWIVRSIYNKTYLSTGWDTLNIESNPEINDNEQAFLAGYLEGIETHVAILDHYYNIVHSICDNETELCGKVNQYLDTNLKWIKEMVDKHGANDSYWSQVRLYYLQLEGLTLGYNSIATSNEERTLRDIMWMNFLWDIGDIMSAFKNETNKAVKGNGHCSALIKILQGESDVLVSHNTWIGYETMRRIVKRYTLPFKGVVGISTSFPSYPAFLHSNDDFYIVSSGLVTQETTNENNNITLWTLLQPEGQVLEVVRVVVANRLADSGPSWAKIFSRYNSGTFNNQWMIVDMNKFSPGEVKPELLWIVEQIPGYIRAEDKTEVLTRQGYWASYNRPFYPDIFNLSGNQPLVEKYGDFFTYDKTPRALMFKRDQDKVKDINTMMKLMRSNDFQHDSLSRCNCSPPYSAENVIAARNDLNQMNGTYPFDALRYRPIGATDAKVTNYQLSKTLGFFAVSGPTTGTNLPPFQWSKADFMGKLSHRGHPDLFNFSPILISWPSSLVNSTIS